MTFTNPSLKEIFQTFVNNDQIIDFLKEKSLLITKKNLKKYYQEEEINDISQYIYFNNVETLYSVSEVLLKNKDIIKSNSMAYLVSNKVAWDDIAEALKVPVITEDTYKNIIFVYKYCYVSSFFQNNKDMFIPENDFFEMENNPAAMAFYDAVMKEFDKLDDILSKSTSYMDSDKIPWDVMTYLTQLLGFEKSTFKLENEEKKFREIAKNILDIYRIKGTNYSFEIFFNFLGFDIEIHEYYFDRRLFYLNDAGNLETDTVNKNSYLFYLTSNSPSENTLNNISTNEIVYPSDISEQYSLEEFDYLVKKYGIKAVLGYSLSDKNGEEYTNKVYKYFKTNHVYYKVYPMDGILTSERVLTINKCLDFLTPSYIFRGAIKSESKVSEADDTISFDGDGSKKPNKDGNFDGGFEFLDDEDWDNFDQDKYVELDSNQNLFVWKGNKEVYKNSLYRNGKDDKEYNKFRIPIATRWMNRSLSRYLTRGLNTLYISNRILKNYTHDGKQYISHKDFFEKGNTLYEEGGKEVPLVGKGSIRECLEKNDISIEIETTDDINNYRELEYFPSSNRTITKVRDFDNLEDVAGLPISNINNKDYPLEENLKKYYENKDICKTLVYGKYCICKNDKNFSLYRYGNYSSSNNLDKYLNSFNYELVNIEELDFSDKEGVFIPDHNSIIRKKTIEEIKKFIEESNNDIKLGKIKDIDYIYNNLYYVNDEKKYYNVIKVPNVNFSQFNNFFENEVEAETDPNKYLNKEAIIGGKLYCCYYSNIKVGELIYDTTSQKLYYVDDFFNLKELKDFYGKIEVEKEVCKLHTYDDAWKGYDEQADNEDFLMYNSYHRINWPEAGFFNEVIGRPIKDQTDSNYNENLFEILLKEFCSCTCNNITSDENLNFLNKIKDSFIDSNVNIGEIKEYSIEEFLKDYYEIVLEKESTEPVADCLKKAMKSIKDYNTSLITLNDREKLEKEDPQYEGEYYSIYKEFDTLLGEYYSAQSVDNFFKKYYYNKLVNLYREKFIEDNRTHFDINDLRRTLITPAAYVSYNSSSGDYLFPHILESSYKTDKNGKDVPIKVYFNKVSVDYSKKILRLHSTLKDIYEAFGYLPNKIDNMILKPTFYVKDKTFYNGKNITSWQKEKHNFDKFYSKGKLIILPNNIMNIEINDSNIKQFDESELNNIEGYVEVNNIEGSFIDSNISYPASFKDTEKDYNGVPAEFVSFGSDRDYEYNIKYGKGINAKPFINKDKKLILKVKDTDMKFNSKIKQIVLL